jgi:hypothetical protein
MVVERPFSPSVSFSSNDAGIRTFTTFSHVKILSDQGYWTKDLAFGMRLKYQKLKFTTYIPLAPSTSTQVCRLLHIKCGEQEK